MSFKKYLKKMSKDEPGVSSYRASISSKLGRLNQIMLDVEDVPALKTMGLELGNLVCTIQSMKEVLGGHGQAEDVKNETPSRKRGPTVSGATRACKPKIVEDLYSVPDDLFAEYFEV